MHEKFGFKKVGQFVEIGYKLGRWVDVGYWRADPLAGVVFVARAQARLGHETILGASRGDRGPRRCTLILVFDMPTALRFYRDVLGFERQSDLGLRRGRQR